MESADSCKVPDSEGFAGSAISRDRQRDLEYIVVEMEREERVEVQPFLRSWPNIDRLLRM